MLQIRQLLFQYSIRNIAINIVNYSRKNPGINKRKNALNLENQEVDEEFDFDELESDFMQVDKSHKQHLSEMESRLEQQKYHIVRDKYFKEKSPNFLTWHDKEQIRYLHRTDPEKWTIEQLSEGFPALPETIAKIIKANWTLSKQSKITNHDNSVQRNWELFKTEQLPNLPNHLVKHLNKFTNRALNLKPFELPNHDKSKFEVRNATRVQGEFSEIISSYLQIKNKTSPEPLDRSKSKITSPPLGDTYLTSKVFNKRKMVTLDQLKSDIEQKVASGRHVKEQDKFLVANLQEKEAPVPIKPEIIEVPQTKYESKAVGNYLAKTERDLSHLSYPQMITIPKKLFKKGHIYKLNDCYYDDDGEFLYRVPGMG